MSSLESNEAGSSALPFDLVGGAGEVGARTAGSQMEIAGRSATLTNQRLFFGLPPKSLSKAPNITPREPWLALRLPLEEHSSFESLPEQEELLLEC